MSRKILIADDESDMVAMLGSFFESRDFWRSAGESAIIYPARSCS